MIDGPQHTYSSNGEDAETMEQGLTFLEENFSAPAWLYQMTSGAEEWHSPITGGPWHPSTYRREVNEGIPNIWDTGRRFYLRGQGPIARDDTIILFFCKTGEADPVSRRIEPGIYGWGRVINPPERPGDRIEFVTLPPSDFLREQVLWGNDVERLVNEIRRRPYQGNIWNITAGQLERLRNLIRRHIAR